MKKISLATGALLTLILTAVSGFAQSQSRDDILKQIEAKRSELETRIAELKALEKLFLSPSEADRAAHANFLLQPDTGLIRLLPREKYESEVYKENKKTISLRGGGAYYSFIDRTNEYGNSHIGFEHGQLKTGFAGANYGMLTNLGEIPLEMVGLEAAAAQILASHVPPNKESEARIEQRRTSSGTTVAGIDYKDRLPLIENSTYLVRSVNYLVSDILVAFRVIRIDSDGSAVILWKLLKKYPVPNLALNN